MPEAKVTSPMGMLGPSTRKGTQSAKSNHPFATKRLLASPRNASTVPGEANPPSMLKGPAVTFVHSNVTSVSSSTASR